MASLHLAICAVLVLSGAANPSGIMRRRDDSHILSPYIQTIWYMVALQDYGDFFCAGSILNPCYVVTSAECVVGKDPKTLTIRASTPYFNESGNVYAARSIIIHPKYSGNGRELDYNVALIRIWVPMTGDFQTIPLAEQEPEVGEFLIVAGWGQEEPGGEYQHQVHYTNVEAADVERCGRIYDSWFAVTDRMICSYAKGRGACDGDNGGPVIFRNKLAGVMSNKLGCGMAPDIHANVANPEIREFILKNAGGKCK